MAIKKYLRYCPNCTHFNKSTGICSYLYENIKDYPESFIKFCNGEYLTLIKGRKILPEYNSKDDAEIIPDDEKIIPDMVTVYSENNSALFQIAKTMLSEKGINFWSNGEYAGVMVSRIPYILTIKVFKKDEKAARSILNNLSSTEPYIATNETDRRINTFMGKYGLIIIFVSVLIMLTVFFIFNEK
jgi:hypothetical protein